MHKSSHKSTKKALPGACDTRAVTPHLPMKTKNANYGIDYLTVTIRESNCNKLRTRLHSTLKNLRTGAYGDPIQRHGFHGFQICASTGFAGIRDNMAMIELPGQAIEIIRRQGFDDNALLQQCKTWHATRADMTIDTTNQKVTPALVARAWHSGNVTCRADDIREMSQTRADGRKSHTVYIGSASSTRMLRVYDKSTQMEFVHGKKIEGTWTRFELQHRHEAATKLIDYLTVHGVEAGLAMINGWISFHDPKSKSKRVERRTLAPWWSELVGKKKIHSGSIRARSRHRKQSHGSKARASRVRYTSRLPTVSRPKSAKRSKWPNRHSNSTNNGARRLKHTIPSNRWR